MIWGERWLSVLFILVELLGSCLTVYRRFCKCYHKTVDQLVNNPFHNKHSIHRNFKFAEEICVRFISNYKTICYCYLLAYLKVIPEALRTHLISTLLLLLLVRYLCWSTNRPRWYHTPNDHCFGTDIIYYMHIYLLLKFTVSKYVSLRFSSQADVTFCYPV